MLAEHIGVPLASPVPKEKGAKLWSRLFSKACACAGRTSYDCIQIDFICGVRISVRENQSRIPALPCPALPYLTLPYTSILWGDGLKLYGKCNPGLIAPGCDLRRSGFKVGDWGRVGHLRCLEGILW